MCWKRLSRDVMASAALLTHLVSGVPAAHAQIVYDGTVGPGGALAGPDFVIPQVDGTVIGTNLFHSFSQFNINTGQSATFTGAAGIGNILSRVTGGNVAAACSCWACSTSRAR